MRRGETIMKFYIISTGGILKGYTENKFIMQQLTRWDLDRFHRNVVDIYHCDTEYELEEYLKEYYFAEETTDYPLLEYYQLRLFQCHDNDDCAATCIHEIYDLITQTGCLDRVSHKLVKSIHDLSVLSKYIVDKNFERMINYIMMSYTYEILRWQYLGVNSKLDKVRLLIALGYLDKI